MWIARINPTIHSRTASGGFPMQPAPATLLASRWYERDGGVGGGFMLQTLRHFWEETYEQAFNSQGLERARAALLASPAVRALMRNREA